MGGERGVSDYCQLFDYDLTLLTRAFGCGSLVLTYWPSEFSQIRGQLRRTNYAEGQTANELLLQVLFTLGRTGLIRSDKEDRPQ